MIVKLRWQKIVKPVMNISVANIDLFSKRTIYRSWLRHNMIFLIYWKNNWTQTWLFSKDSNYIYRQNKVLSFYGAQHLDTNSIFTILFFWAWIQRNQFMGHFMGSVTRLQWRVTGQSSTLIEMSVVFDHPFGDRSFLTFN